MQRAWPTVSVGSTVPIGTVPTGTLTPVGDS
jgi:hypothetical protein